MMLRRGALLISLLGLLAACSSSDVDPSYPSDQNTKQKLVTKSKIFGDDISLFSTKKAEPEDQGGGGIGVNSFLWRASLDTLSFMPLSSADPFGGVIITDWYAPPETAGERFKINVFILGRGLRADGVRAAVFRQRMDGYGNWLDAAVDEQTTVELEDAILTRARQLRIASVE